MITFWKLWDWRFSHRFCSRFKSSGKWLSVAGAVIPSTSEDHSASIFSIKQSKKNQNIGKKKIWDTVDEPYLHHWCIWRSRQHDTSKCWEPLTQRHNITSQKSGMLNLRRTDRHSTLYGTQIFTFLNTFIFNIFILYRMAPSERSNYATNAAPNTEGQFAPPPPQYNRDTHVATTAHFNKFCIVFRSPAPREIVVNSTLNIEANSNNFIPKIQGVKASVLICFSVMVSLSFCSRDCFGVWGKNLLS
jgi:hypothetical protein